MVGYRMQTDPAVRRLRELLRGGFVGDVVHIHGTMSQTMLGELSEDTDQWRLDPAFYERDAREVTLVRDGVRSEIELDPVHQLEEEFAYFGHHLLTDTDFLPDGEHALTDMRVLDAVYESAATGRPVTLPE